VLERLESGPAGLADTEHARRLAVHGPNPPEGERRREPWWEELGESVTEPLQLLLAWDGDRSRHPALKHRIVQLLQQRGEIVAVTGDGANDAPALAAANAGIALGRRGADLARWRPRSSPPSPRLAGSSACSPCGPAGCPPSPGWSCWPPSPPGPPPGRRCSPGGCRPTRLRPRSLARTK
jgi:Cation transporter/ATPase, N-terminus/haloacid dehalogenase-like hydrolase